MYNPYAELKHTNHTARYFSGPGYWGITDRNHEAVAIVVMNSTKQPNSLGRKRTVTTCEITLILGRHELPLDPITHPGGLRTTLRWVCQELNRRLWLSTRLALERKARLLGYEESELLACEHAYDYQYCLRLVSNIPGLVTD